MKDVFRKHLKHFGLETLSLFGNQLTKAAMEAKNEQPLHETKEIKPERHPNTYKPFNVD